VLPFANLSADADNEYFSDGLTEELINALAQVPGLRVVSRSSTFQFKGKNQDIHEVGRKLGVRNVLDGSVRKSGNRIRITAQLGDVSRGCLVWSERFDREVQDIFAVQDEVVRSILSTLKPKLGTSFRPPASKPRAENFAAHELYLKGRYFYNQQTPEGLAKAVAYFEQAAALAPGHAMAQVGLADCHLLRVWYGLTPAAESMPKARETAQRALEIDDTVALAHCALALVQAGYEWHWAEAEARFSRALELGSGFAAIHFHYALDYLTPMGRLADAIQQICLAQELDPISLITRTALGGCFYRNRQYDAAIDQFQNTLRIDPDFYHAHWSLARALKQKCVFDDAVEEFQNANQLAGGGNPLILGELGHCYGLMSRTAEARQLLEDLEEISRRVYVSPFCAAFVHLGLGNRDEVFQRLEQALEERSRALLWIGVDPRFEVLRTDARFRRLLQRMGLPVDGEQ
jgi:TolB-like protein